MIIKTELDYHDLYENIIEAEEGALATYHFESTDTIPIEKFSFKAMKYQLLE